MSTDSIEYPTTPIKTIEDAQKFMRAWRADVPGNLNPPKGSRQTSRVELALRALDFNIAQQILRKQMEEFDEKYRKRLEKEEERRQKQRIIKEAKRRIAQEEFEAAVQAKVQELKALR